MWDKNGKSTGAKNVLVTMSVLIFLIASDKLLTILIIVGFIYVYIDIIHHHISYNTNLIFVINSKLMFMSRVSHFLNGYFIKIISVPTIINVIRIIKFYCI